MDTTYSIYSSPNVEEIWSFKSGDGKGMHMSKYLKMPVSATDATLALIVYQISLFGAKKDVLPQGWNPRNQEYLIYLLSSVPKQK